MPKKRRRTPFKDFFLPHRGNRYKPSYFSAASVLTIVVAVLLLEGAYLASTRVLFPNTSFLASVLPSVLADLTNQDRASVDVPPVAIDPVLSEAAQDKANDMAAKGYFAHISPSGQLPWYWFNQVGYKYTYAGENLAVNFTDSDGVEQAWMASPTHHANIVKPQYTKVGFGVAQGQYEGKSATFVVEFFAAQPAGAAEPRLSATPEGKAEATATAAPQIALAANVPVAASANAVVEGTSSASTTAVLGTEISPPAPTVSLGFLGSLATSPEHTLMYILAALIILTGVLLAIAIVVKVRIQYREVITGGLAVLLVALALLILTETTATKVIIPSGAQSASVFQALGS